MIIEQKNTVGGKKCTLYGIDEAKEKNYIHLHIR